VRAEYNGGVSEGSQRVYPVQVRRDGRLLYLSARPTPGPLPASRLPGPAGEAHQVPTPAPFHSQTVHEEPTVRRSKCRNFPIFLCFVSCGTHNIWGVVLPIVGIQRYIVLELGKNHGYPGPLPGIKGQSRQILCYILASGKLNWYFLQNRLWF
jgi:hypothetical protein